MVADDLCSMLRDAPYVGGEARRRGAEKFNPSSTIAAGGWRSSFWLSTASLIDMPLGRRARSGRRHRPSPLPPRTEDARGAQTIRRFAVRVVPFCNLASSSGIRSATRSAPTGGGAIRAAPAVRRTGSLGDREGRRNTAPCERGSYPKLGVLLAAQATEVAFAFKAAPLARKARWTKNERRSQWPLQQQ